MDSREYLDILNQRYERYFNVHRDYTLLEKDLDIFAEYNVRNERYFFTKSTVIYSFENYEYCLVKSFDKAVDEEALEDFTQYLVRAVKNIVKPNSEHMSTFLTGVMVSQDGFSEKVIEKAQKFKYSKDFLFTLKGWCDVRLILVDLKGNEIITNKKGKEVKKNYTVNS